MIKAYHKANEERKEIHQELVETRDQFTKAKNGRPSMNNEMPSVANRKHTVSHSNASSNQSLFLPSIYTSHDQYESSGRRSEYK